MPTLNKIKRTTSRNTSLGFRSIFSFAQPHKKPYHQNTSGRFSNTMTELHTFSIGRKVDLQNLKFYIA